MGGSIAIAARFNDGEAICIDGWTNFIPRMVMNDVTLSGDDSVVRATLMEAAAHEAYSGPRPFGEHGYGIVVIDFVSRMIHSKQGYTGFTEKMPSQLLELNECGWRDGPEGPHYVQVLSEEAKAMLDAGRVRKTSIDGEPCEPVLLDQEASLAMLREEFVAFMSGGSKPFVGLTIDTAPFTIHDHPECGTLTAMREDLRDAGFPLTKAQGLNRMLAGLVRPKKVAA
jgi:hypothetical protein